MKLIRSNKKPASRVKLAAAALAFALTAYLGLTYFYQQSSGTQQFLVASAGLAAGQQVAESSFQAAEFDLGSAGQAYLKPGELSAGAYLLGPIRAGQLIPKSALADAIIDSRVPVVLSSAMPLPAALQPGASVDVWVTPMLEDRSFGEPYLLVLAAEVALITEASAVFADAPPEVELWVPAEAVAAVLKAQAGQSQLSLVMRPTFADG